MKTPRRVYELYRVSDRPRHALIAYISSFGLAQIKAEGQPVQYDRGGVVKTFRSRAKLRAYLVERRLDGDTGKYRWEPPFPFVKDAPGDFIHGTNIRKEES